jgi:negative regulator of flagellin synthesis FlgM
MRIEDKPNALYGNVSSTVKKDTEQSKTGSRQKAQEDRVELSSFRKVDNLVERVKSSSEVRAEKVSEIRKQIESGTYDFSGRKVAEKIVNTAVDDLF